MGLTLSKDTTSDELADFLAGLNDTYAPYAKAVRDNLVDGATLLSCRSKEDAAELMEELGVTKLHARVLIAKLLEVIEKSAQPTTVFSAPVKAAGGGAGGPRGALPHVPDKITQDPRSIMRQIFAIQGDDVDPKNLKSIIDKVGSDIRERVAAGWANGTDKFDCFISYRVAADKDVAEKIYLSLKALNPPIYAFLDQYCLKSGEPWKDGFIRGLHSSRVFVAVLSAKALEWPRNFHSDHSKDNVMIEYETALKICSDTGNDRFILPLLVGEYIGDGPLYKFGAVGPSGKSNFDLSLYSNSIVALASPEEERKQREIEEESYRGPPGQVQEELHRGPNRRQPGQGLARGHR